MGTYNVVNRADAGDGAVTVFCEAVEVEGETTVEALRSLTLTFATVEAADPFSHQVSVSVSAIAAVDPNAVDTSASTDSNLPPQDSGQTVTP